MKLLTLTSAILAAATVAQAQDYACTFTTECYDVEGCSETFYELEIVEGVLSDVNGDQEGRLIEEEGHVIFSTDNQAPFSLTTITDAGEARLVILDGPTPYTIVYGGTCKPK